MNGRAPGYSSKAMIAIVAYIAWLSRGNTIGAKATRIRPLHRTAAQRFAERRARVPHSTRKNARPVTRATGRAFPERFRRCGARARSTNGAGMAHIDRMTGFVRYNMPQDAPGSLSLAQAYDVAAFVLHHPRPHFRKNAVVSRRNRSRPSISSRPRPAP